jgi:hypothetical protein
LKLNSEKKLQHVPAEVSFALKVSIVSWQQSKQQSILSYFTARILRPKYIFGTATFCSVSENCSIEKWIFSG